MVERQPVLILLDLQEGTCRTGSVLGDTGLGAEVARRGVLASAARALGAFRAAALAIIHVRVAFDPEYLRMTSSSPRFRRIKERRLLQDGDPSTRICDEVAPVPGEPVITKGCVNAFVGTDLASMLIRLFPAELVLGGVATNHAVESTTRLAADMGYPVVVLEDLCASFDRPMHEFAVSQILPAYAEVTSSDEYLRSRPSFEAKVPEIGR